jgi:hypothetical protein
MHLTIVSPFSIKHCLNQTELENKCTNSQKILNTSQKKTMTGTLSGDYNNTQTNIVSGIKIIFSS